MLRYRLIFGPVMICLALLLFWADNHLDTVPLTGFWQDLFLGRSYLPSGLLLLGAVLILIPLAAWELAAVFRANQIEASTWLIAFAAVISCVTVYTVPRVLSAPDGVAIITTVLIACFLITLLWHSRRARVEGVVAAAGATMFAVAYLGLMAGFFLAMRRWHSAWVVLAILLITKSCDIGAYFTGRAIGRHKLIPWLSPGKTWEGLFGGIALASLLAAGLAFLSHHTTLADVYRTIDHQRVLVPVDFHPGYAALAGAFLAIVGQLGDLTMSLFKRDANLKDSGSVIPGFGGVLDVLDSPLLVAPVAYWMLMIPEVVR